MITHRSRQVLSVLAVVAGLMGAVTPSHAGHNTCSTSLSISLHSGSWSSTSYRCPPRRSYAQRQYDEGYSLGACHGERDGYHDGLHGHEFCDAPRICLPHRSHHFLTGYEDGYAWAYDRAYHDGECARRPSHGRHRRW